MRANWPAYIRQGTVVRFSIGLEAVKDLQADLEQALTKALS
jgi:cysteine-S-conjugate beta-lyase